MTAIEGIPIRLALALAFLFALDNTTAQAVFGHGQPPQNSKTAIDSHAIEFGNPGNAKGANRAIGLALQDTMRIVPA